MKWLGLIVVATTLGSTPVWAQSQINHDVQKAWDNIFDPGPPGDPRTHWERMHDDERYSWCHEHPGVEQCRPYYRR